MYIIDTFSKFGGCYILNNKKGETILGSLKDFIYKNGKPLFIHSDNGKEFCNNIFEDYCNTNNIKIIRGRLYHPQSQGIVESFNKEIKRLLENNYLENPKKFFLENALPDIVKYIIIIFIQVRNINLFICLILMIKISLIEL